MHWISTECIFLHRFFFLLLRDSKNKNDGNERGAWMNVEWDCMCESVRQYECCVWVWIFVKCEKFMYFSSYEWLPFENNFFALNMVFLYYIPLFFCALIYTHENKSSEDLVLFFCHRHFFSVHKRKNASAFSVYIHIIFFLCALMHFRISLFIRWIYKS